MPRPDPAGAADGGAEQDPVQAAIDARRADSEARFRAILGDPRQAPAMRFPELRPEEVARRTACAERFTLVVSFHTRAYFLMLLLLEASGVAVTAIVTPGIAARFRDLRRLAPKGLALATGLSHEEVKRCVAEKRMLFVMADVLIAYGSNAPLPIMGRAMRYTVSWAELATKLRLDLVVGLVKDRGKTAEILLRPLPGPHRDPYELACAACAVFDEFMAGDEALWENHPALEAYGYKLPRCDRPSPDLAELLRRLASCDAGVAKALREGLLAQAPRP